MRTLEPRVAVAVVFGANGFLFACLVSRLADVRSGLSLSNGALGVLLLAISAGSLLALPLTGRLVARFGAASIVRLGLGLDVVGLVVAGLGVAAGSVPVTAAGWFLYGAGVGSWDVAMNVEAAEVERGLGRTIMPRFHAGWSLGSFAGAGVGIVVTALDVPLLAHLVGGAVLVAAATLSATAGFASARVAAIGGAAGDAEGRQDDGADPTARRAGRSPWTEPRTLAIGVMVLAFAVVEGSANDWLTLGLIDGYGAPHWLGVAGFATFVVAMTTGRLLGPVALDRVGRAPVLWACSAAAGVGVLLTVGASRIDGVAGGAVAVVGILLWGLGASLGFPVGMSAAADDPERSALRVGVVSTIGYGAFLAGPPLLGRLGDAVGTLESLLAVAVLMVPAALTVAAVRRAPGTAPA
ncbi:MFS transporter [Nocardioides sp. TRM66260-LWL]|uniref:MFS transporter n=1 Tax=Nocardioides sp. TRM66260-LWL TaxID=2874478 RepID=UPI001CC36BDE|nr:MFS transporter [Nocardioides sp. TRM66260-LWL]MBZ5734250.1 MFS transporter [Nocardioides sp. TRM66260-LWL]